MFIILFYMKKDLNSFDNWVSSTLNTLNDILEWYDTLQLNET